MLQGVALCSVIRRARTERTVPPTKPRYLRTAQVAEFLHVSRAGLPHRLWFHDLRHTCASLLIGQGASVKAVQAQLGPASRTPMWRRCGPSMDRGC